MKFKKLGIIFTGLLMTVLAQSVLAQDKLIIPVIEETIKFTSNKTHREVYAVKAVVRGTRYTSRGSIAGATLGLCALGWVVGQDSSCNSTEYITINEAGTFKFNEKLGTLSYKIPESRVSTDRFDDLVRQDMVLVIDVKTRMVSPEGWQPITDDEKQNPEAYRKVYEVEYKKKRHQWIDVRLTRAAFNNGYSKSIYELEEEFKTEMQKQLSKPELDIGNGTDRPYY
ncbi:MAG: hypothetical protein AABY64_14395 [Bdellovibrionota bacterium]